MTGAYEDGREASHTLAELIEAALRGYYGELGGPMSAEVLDGGGKLRYEALPAMCDGFAAALVVEIAETYGEAGAQTDAETAAEKIQAAIRELQAAADALSALPDPPGWYDSAGGTYETE
jgi:hypothetical protein